MLLFGEDICLVEANILETLATPASTCRIKNGKAIASTHKKLAQLDASWDCLRKTDNLSSASVLVVLQEVMKRRRPRLGRWD